jgi:uncharacterized protein
MFEISRLVETELQIWKDKPHRMPLLVRGARQIGKSHVIEAFGRAHFNNTVVVNLEQNPALIRIFETLNPKQIVAALSAVLDAQIMPGKTLLFIDEIQVSPKAIMSLRYFYEQYSELHVIAAGSLLEFTLTDETFSMPVGRVEYLYMLPVTLREYCQSVEGAEFIKYLSKINVGDTIPDAIHQKGLEITKHYCLLGGMPKVLSVYQATNDLKSCQSVQAQILNTYRDDFRKYGKRINVDLCETLFRKAPNLIAKHFKYVDVDPDQSAKSIKPALQAMKKAGLYHSIHNVAAQGLPLNSHILSKKFKLLFLDIGLIKNMARLDAELMLADDLSLVHLGKLTEQLVGQELLALQETHFEPELFFWQRDKKSSTAELDYVIQLDSSIVPIEVKSGKTGRLKSLQLFLEETRLNPAVCDFGVKISKAQFGFDKTVLSVPFYMISELPRLIKSAKSYLKNV